jgi:hypothetical protein
VAGPAPGCPPLPGTTINAVATPAATAVAATPASASRRAGRSHLARGAAGRTPTDRLADSGRCAAAPRALSLLIPL